MAQFGLNSYAGSTASMGFSNGACCRTVHVVIVRGISVHTALMQDSGGNRLVRSLRKASRSGVILRLLALCPAFYT